MITFDNTDNIPKMALHPNDGEGYRVYIYWDIDTPSFNTDETCSAVEKTIREGQKYFQQKEYLR